MSASASNLQRIVTDLQHAAGAGATRLAHQVVADGRAQAELGAAVATPGPGLTALLGHSGRASTTAQAQIDLAPVTDHMVTELVDGGLDLALGRRR